MLGCLIIPRGRLVVSAVAVLASSVFLIWQRRRNINKRYSFQGGGGDQQKEKRNGSDQSDFTSSSSCSSLTPSSSDSSDTGETEETLFCYKKKRSHDAVYSAHRCGKRASEPTYTEYKTSGVCNVDQPEAKGLAQCLLFLSENASAKPMAFEGSQNTLKESPLANLICSEVVTSIPSESERNSLPFHHIPCDVNAEDQLSQDRTTSWDAKERSDVERASAAFSRPLEADECSDTALPTMPSSMPFDGDECSDMELPMTPSSTSGHRSQQVVSSQTLREMYDDLQELPLRDIECSEDRMWALQHIRMLLIASGFCRDRESILANWHSQSEPLDPLLCEKMISLLRIHRSLVDDYALLFGCTNEALFKILSPFMEYERQPWRRNSKVARKCVPTGKKLLKEIWKEIGYRLDTQQKHSDNSIRQEEVPGMDVEVEEQGAWFDLRDDIEGIVSETEASIFNELIGDVLRDLIGEE